MKIAVTGGGSGGHITPILAVAKELKNIDPTVEIVYIGQRGDSLADVPAVHPSISAAYSVRAGKFRRYHGEGLKQLLDFPTVYKNLRDFIWVLVGLVQSFKLLRRLRPDVIFVKGGFVGVPVGLAAALLKIPYVTHDSDAIPGLANRIIARWAQMHAVALPEELYSYPRSKTVTVGVPVSAEYQLVTPETQKQFKRELQIEPNAPVVLITGGGNGARDLNHLVVNNAAHMLSRQPNLVILHLTGRALEAETTAAYKAALKPEQLSHIRVMGFINDFYRHSGAADVIVARGSATNLAEFALQAKACVIIPASQLVWTVRNTETLAKDKAVIALTDAQAEQELRFANTVLELLSDSHNRQQLGDRLHTYAHPDAAKRLAELLMEIVA